MFCESCGKPIEENVSFCPYCGKPVAKQVVHPTVNMPVNMPVQGNGNGNGKGKAKYFVIGGIVVAVIIALIIAVVLLLKKNADLTQNRKPDEGYVTAVEDTEQEYEPEDVTENTTEEASYPENNEVHKELTEEEIEGLTDFVLSLAYSGYDTDPKIFCSRYIFGSLHVADWDKMQQYYGGIDKDNNSFQPTALRQYLMNSIGYDDLAKIEQDTEFDNGYFAKDADGNFIIYPYDTGDSEMMDPIITEMTVLDNGDVLAAGEVETRVEGEHAVTTLVEVVMTPNPNSIWGGYSLKELHRCDDYFLAHSDSQYLTEEELAGYNEYQLRMMRNEIYARHGYIFKTDDLSNYFEQQNWYEPTIPEVTEDMLNEYEKANLNLIIELEK